MAQPVPQGVKHVKVTHMYQSLTSRKSAKAGEGTACGEVEIFLFVVTRRATTPPTPHAQVLLVIGSP
jgi:hypothetical protein